MAPSFDGHSKIDRTTMQEYEHHISSSTLNHPTFVDDELLPRDIGCHLRSGAIVTTVPLVK
jgi:hypothetical protein